MAKRTNSIRIQLLLFVSLILPINMQQEQCYVDVTSPYEYFASKTAYHVSRGSDMKIPPNCSPIYIWALIRHGTRYPNEHFIKSMQNLYTIRDQIILNHRDGRGRLCEKDVKILENWSTNVTNVDDSDDLTTSGAEEMVFLAQKFKQTFPQFLESLSRGSFIFQTTSADRTKDSAVAFTNELLGTNFTDTEANNITENENLLHISKICTSYIATKDDPSIQQEKNLFKNSDFMKKLLSDISTRLGFEKPLPYRTLKLMFLTCAFENAWYVNSRPAFCAAFLPEQLKVFEYAMDLIHYYDNGYGNTFAPKMGCVILRDMMMKLSDAARNSNASTKAAFYFSHAESVFPMTVKLGLRYDEEPLKHDNYEKMINGRKWKTHVFNSFASNIVAVLYKCQTSQGDQNTVIFYQSERQVVPPKCTTNHCTLEDLQKNFHEVFNETQCDLEFCHITSSGSAHLPNLILSIFVISIFLDYLTFRLK